MSPLPCTALILGLLAASVSAAEAGNNPSIEVLPQTPTPEPTPLASAPAPAAAALAPRPQTRSERKEARRQAMIERRKERRQAALHLREERQQAALQRRAAKLGLKTPASAAVAIAAPAAMAGITESPAPTPAAGGGQLPAAPHDAEAAPTLSDLVARHAMENGVPVKLAQAVVAIESRGNARAANHGALGLMQIKYGTARAAGFSGAAAGLLVAETNLHFGMKVLADAYRSARGDLCGTLMRYQSGHLATRMTRSNRAYCSRARSLMAGV